MDDDGGWWIVSIHYSFLLQEQMFNVAQLRKNNQWEYYKIIYLWYIYIKMKRMTK